MEAIGFLVSILTTPYRAGGFMKRFSFFTICFIAGLSFILSCNDDSVGPDKDLDSMAVTDFPNMTEIWWKYQVYDSLGSLFDTVRVACEGNTTLHGRNAVIWVYHYRTYQESLYVYVSDDTIYFFNDTSYTQPLRFYVFPLKVGHFWLLDPSSHDTTEVIQKGTVATEAGEFPNSFLVSTEWDYPDNVGDEKIWISRGVGIVKERIYSTTLATTSITKWDLISFQTPLQKIIFVD
jgi:hypothetical protein